MNSLYFVYDELGGMVGGPVELGAAITLAEQAWHSGRTNCINVRRADLPPPKLEEREQTLALQREGKMIARVRANKRMRAQIRKMTREEKKEREETKKREEREEREIEERLQIQKAEIRERIQARYGNLFDVNCANQDRSDDDFAA